MTSLEEPRDARAGTTLGPGREALLRGLREPHACLVQVHFEDTDVTGLAYHPGLLRFCDRARTMLLGARTIVALKVQENLNFAVHKLNATFLSPARFGDVLRVTTRIRLSSPHKLEFEQELHQAHSGVLAARVHTRVVCVDARGRVSPIPVSRILDLLGECHEVSPREGLEQTI